MKRFLILKKNGGHLVLPTASESIVLLGKAPTIYIRLMLNDASEDMRFCLTKGNFHDIEGLRNVGYWTKHRPNTILGHFSQIMTVIFSFSSCKCPAVQPAWRWLRSPNQWSTWAGLLGPGPSPTWPSWRPILDSLSVAPIKTTASWDASHVASITQWP